MPHRDRVPLPHPVAMLKPRCNTSAAQQVPQLQPRDRDLPRQPTQGAGPRDTTSTRQARATPQPRPTAHKANSTRKAPRPQTHRNTPQHGKPRHAATPALDRYPTRQHDVATANSSRHPHAQVPNKPRDATAGNSDNDEAAVGSGMGRRGNRLDCIYFIMQ
jgi:hypothetical protein